MISVLRDMGFSISWKKVSQPSTKTTFLGIIIDSMEMKLSLPEDFFFKLHELIDTLELNGSATKKQLESLGGLVSHFSSVIRGVRTFCRRIYYLCSKCKRGRRIKLDEEIILDLN